MGRERGGKSWRALLSAAAPSCPLQVLETGQGEVAPHRLPHHIPLARVSEAPWRRCPSGSPEPRGSVRSSSWVGPRAHVSVSHAHSRSRPLGGRLGRGAAPGSPVLPRGSPVALIHGCALPSLGRSTFRLLWRNAWCGVEGTPLCSRGRSPVGCGRWPAAYPAGSEGQPGLRRRPDPILSL